MLHASDEYYEHGGWYDSVLAQHIPARRGGARRQPDERSRAEARAVAPPATVNDVARNRGLYHCTVPDGRCAGQVVPFLYVTWMRYFNAFRHMQVGEGEASHLLRCRSRLADWDIEGVKVDSTELPYMLVPDEVEAIVYLQRGYYTPRSGPPDFYFVDRVWDKMGKRMPL